MRRFWSKTRESETGCLLWTASKDSKGYGHFWLNDKLVTASRVAWILEIGDIPEGMSVCHRCDTPACVNPEHLFLGTHQENMIDRDDKGRNVNHIGERHGMAKLTEADVIAIRTSGEPAKTLAAEYDMSVGAIRHILKRRTWRHV